MTHTEKLIAALERLDKDCCTAERLNYEGFYSTAALRNALPALIELVKHYKAAVDFLGYDGEAQDDCARVLEALGEGGGDE